MENLIEITQQYQLFFSQHIIYFYILATLIGFLFGSFLNVFIIRWPLINDSENREAILSYLDELDEKDEWKNHNLNKTVSKGLPKTLNGRSYCSNCGDKIPWFANIPILSYIILKGKCRSCKKNISKQYIIIESLSGIGTLILALAFQPSLLFVFSCFFLYLSISMIMIDYKHMLLPDETSYILLWLGLLMAIVSNQWLISLEEAVISVIISYLLLSGFVKIYAYLRNIEFAMGDGDFKLLAAISAIVGYQFIYVIFLSSIIGAFFAIVMFLINKKLNKINGNNAIPFGPSLIIAGWLIWINQYFTIYYI